MFVRLTDKSLRQRGFVRLQDAAKQVGQHPDHVERSLRSLGVPLTTNGMMTKLGVWAPGWAVELARDWPLVSGVTGQAVLGSNAWAINDASDWQFNCLKRLIRFLCRHEQHTNRIQQFITMARLGGTEAIETFIKENQQCGS